jgi:hypothetical protein
MKYKFRIYSKPNKEGKTVYYVKYCVYRFFPIFWLTDETYTHGAKRPISHTVYCVSLDEAEKRASIVRKQLMSIYEKSRLIKEI